MSYVLVDYRESTIPLVAVYSMRAGQEHRAECVIGTGVFRDMEARGSENLVVPIVASDLESTQTHIHASRDAVLESYGPSLLVNDELLYDQVRARGGWVKVLDGEDGSWTVAR